MSQYQYGIVIITFLLTTLSVWKEKKGSDQKVLRTYQERI